MGYYVYDGTCIRFYQRTIPCIGFVFLKFNAARSINQHFNIWFQIKCFKYKIIKSHLLLSYRAIYIRCVCVNIIYTNLVHTINFLPFSAHHTCLRQFKKYKFILQYIVLLNYNLLLANQTI